MASKPESKSQPHESEIAKAIRNLGEGTVYTPAPLEALAMSLAGSGLAHPIGGALELVAEAITGATPTSLDIGLSADTAQAMDKIGDALESIAETLAHGLNITVTIKQG